MGALGSKKEIVKLWCTPRLGELFQEGRLIPGQLTHQLLFPATDLETLHVPVNSATAPFVPGPAPSTIYQLTQDESHHIQ